MLDCLRCNETGDYIPGGKPARYVANPRPVPEGVYARCGAKTGDDLQSGPLYCSDRAVLVADACTRMGEVEGTVYVCRRHEGRLREDVWEEECRRRERDKSLEDDSIEGA